LESKYQNLCEIIHVHMIHNFISRMFRLKTCKTITIPYFNLRKQKLHRKKGPAQNQIQMWQIEIGGFLK